MQGYEILPRLCQEANVSNSMVSVEQAEVENDL